MIIGNGLLASGFIKKGKEYKDYIIFASGVSNSKETDQNNFDREKNLIIKTINENKKLTFIYFSSILVGITDNKYYNHKLEMESIIKNLTNNYVIFRVPQIIGKNGNKNNLINFIKSSIVENKEITIFHNVARAIIDIKDLVKIVDYCRDVHDLTEEHKTVTVSYIEKIYVSDLVDEISLILNKKPTLKYVDDNIIQIDNWHWNNTNIVDHAIEAHNIKIEGYTKRIIKKYIKK